MGKHIGQLLDSIALTRSHKLIFILAAQGLFLSGYNFFVITLASPLMISQWHCSHFVQGFIAAAAPLGAIFGSSILGYFTDILGRKKILLFNTLVIILFTIASSFATNVWLLIAARFFLGMGLGGDYPVTATYLSEVIPKHLRGSKMAVVMLINCLGIFASVLIGYIVLVIYPHVFAWRVMLFSGLVPAIIIFFMRTGLPESPRWLVGKARIIEAQYNLEKFTPKSIDMTQHQTPMRTSIWQLFSPVFIKITFLVAVCWFLMDAAYYGLGLFTPLVFKSLNIFPAKDMIAQDIYIAQATVFSNIFVLLGAILSLFFIKHSGRLILQLSGFVGAGIALFILSMHTTWPVLHVVLIFSGFILFNLFMNLGPGLTTYLLPAEFYPTQLRATGHGFATACGKLGAVLGITFFPLAQYCIGTDAIIIILGFGCLIAAALTHALGVETRHKCLEDVTAALESSKSGV